MRNTGEALNSVPDEGVERTFHVDGLGSCQRDSLQVPDAIEDETALVVSRNEVALLLSLTSMVTVRTLSTTLMMK